MDITTADLICCFARTLRDLGRDEPSHEYTLTRNEYENPTCTEILVSWVGDRKEIPEWLAHETYEVEPRWVRHYLSTRIQGTITGLAVFDCPEVAALAKDYLQQRYPTG